MISEASSDNEDTSYGISGMNYILKYIKQKTAI